MSLRSTSLTERLSDDSEESYRSEYSNATSNAPSRANSFLSQGVRSGYTDAYYDDDGVGSNRSYSRVSGDESLANASFDSRLLTKLSSRRPSEKRRGKKKSLSLSASASKHLRKSSNLSQLTVDTVGGNNSRRNSEANRSFSADSVARGDFSSLLRRASGTGAPSGGTSQPFADTSATANSSKKSKNNRASRLLQEVPFTFVIKELKQRMSSNTNKRDALVFTILTILFTISTVTDTRLSYIGSRVIAQNFCDSFFPSQEKQIEKFRQRVGLLGLTPWVTADKVFIDIRDHIDWANYVQDIFITTLFPSEETKRTTAREAFVKNMIPVGAMRFRTIRAAPNSSKRQESLYPDPDTGPYYPRFSWATNPAGSRELKDPVLCPDIRDPLSPSEPLYRYQPCEKRVGGSLKGRVGEYHCGGYIFDIPFRSNASMVDKYIHALRNITCPFVNTWETRLVSMNFFLFAPSLRGFYKVEFYSEATSSGWAFNHPSYTFFDAHTKTSTTPLLVFLSVTFAVFLFYVGMFLYYLINSIRHGKKSAKEFFSRPLTYVDIAICGSGLTYFILRYVCIAKSFSLFSREEFVYPFDFPYPVDLNQIFYYCTVWRPAAACCLFLMCLRVFRVFYLFKPLEAIMQTINSFMALYWVIIFLFAINLVGFGLAGWSMFSQSMPAFESIGRSLLTLLLLQFSSPTFYPVENVNKGAFFCFIFVYYTLVLMLTLHFTVAVASASFTEHASKHLMTYDDTWIKRHIKIMINKFTVRRVKVFLSTLFGIHNENHYLSEVCTTLEEYLEEQVAVDMRGRRNNAGPRMSIVSSRTSTAGSQSRGVREPSSTPKKVTSGTTAVITSHENFDATDSSTGRASVVVRRTKPRETVDTRRINRDQYKMSYSQWSELLSNRLYKQCGGVEYFADLWRSIVEALRDFEETPDQMDFRDRRAQTQALTHHVMNSELIKIENLDRTISDLEQHVTNLYDITQYRERMVQAEKEEDRKDSTFYDVPDIT